MVHPACLLVAIEVCAENTKRPPFREVEAHERLWFRVRALAAEYYWVGGWAQVHNEKYGASKALWQHHFGAIPAHVGAVLKHRFCNIGCLVARIGVYPGSFNPPTKAHLEIAGAAVAKYSLQRLDFALSVSPLGKAKVEVPSFEHRLEVIEESLCNHQNLAVVVTEAQLITDIADGYDIVVMGADKWHQVNDPGWYNNDVQARDRAVNRLPTVALAPRPPHVIPEELQLPVPDDLLEISSTAARAGQTEWMTVAAAQFDAETGAWTDPARYQRWQVSGT